MTDSEEEPESPIIINSDSESEAEKQTSAPSASTGRPSLRRTMPRRVEETPANQGFLCLRSFSGEAGGEERRRAKKRSVNFEEFTEDEAEWEQMVDRAE